MFDYPKVTVDYEELITIDINSIESNPFNLVVYKQNVKYEFVIKINKISKKIICFGSGAYNPDKLSPPIYNRITWMDEFGCNILYYNDPTLYLGKIRLGWGYGDKDRHYCEEIADIINILLSKLNIINNNAYFFGSSGGGFMSMILATMIKNSTAIVNNPQISIINYFPMLVKPLFIAVYGVYDDNIINENLYRISVIECMKKYDNVPKIFYAQNLSCNTDMKNHAIPFIEEMRHLEHTKNINFIFYYDKIAGHNAISKKDTINLIKDVMNDKYIKIVDIPSRTKK